MSTILLVVLAVASACQARSTAGVPSATLDEKPAAAPTKETAVLAGGCFWGVQAVFQHVRGVVSATSGYAGGSLKNPNYETVSTGQTGHAESVEIVYDPSQITYGKLLWIFFSVVHDPTELNRQGPDEGTQYRSAIFYTNDVQKHVAEAYIGQLEQAHVFEHKIVTQVTELKGFYPAEAYHQNYATLHPMDTYIMFNDAPKVANLKKDFPEMYTGK
jgi:peptide-methionine (S)-S-oxide reductase